MMDLHSPVSAVHPSVRGGALFRYIYLLNAMNLLECLRLKGSENGVRVRREGKVKIA